VLAKELKLPLDIIITKKIGHPADPEFAVGAVGPTGEPYLTGTPVPEDYIKVQTKQLQRQIAERYKLYRGDKPLPDLKNKIVIIIDDGLATGSTMMVAVNVIKQQKPKKVIVAVPVAPTQAVELFKREADDIICLEVPEMFLAIGEFYVSFSQVEDEEAIKLLKEANE